MIKLVIFDWDDVITIGAMEGFIACYHRAINGVGIYLSKKEEYHRIILKWGKNYKEEIKELLKEHPKLVDKACRIFENEFWENTYLNPLRVIAGTNELLLRLKTKYLLAIITGNEKKMIEKKVIPRFKIPDVFTEIISSSDFTDPKQMKPHPFMANLIMKKLKVTPKETVFVGDAIGDVKMAISAKVKPIVVLTGQLNKEKAEELGVKYIVDDVTKIEEILNKLP